MTGVCDESTGKVLLPHSEFQFLIAVLFANHGNCTTVAIVASFYPKKTVTVRKTCLG
jgi:hypothetical protein